MAKLPQKPLVLIRYNPAPYRHKKAILHSKTPPRLRFALSSPSSLPYPFLPYTKTLLTHRKISIYTHIADSRTRSSPIFHTPFPSHPFLILFLHYILIPLKHRRALFHNHVGSGQSWKPWFSNMNTQLKSLMIIYTLRSFANADSHRSGDLQLCDWSFEIQLLIKNFVEHEVKCVSKRKGSAGILSARIHEETSIGKRVPVYTNSVITVATLDATVCWLHCCLKAATM